MSNADKIKVYTDTELEAMDLSELTSKLWQFEDLLDENSREKRKIEIEVNALQGKIFGVLVDNLSFFLNVPYHWPHHPADKSALTYTVNNTFVSLSEIGDVSTSSNGLINKFSELGRHYQDLENIWENLKNIRSTVDPSKQDQSLGLVVDILSGIKIPNNPGSEGYPVVDQLWKLRDDMAKDLNDIVNDPSHNNTLRALISESALKYSQSLTDLIKKATLTDTGATPYYKSLWYEYDSQIQLSDYLSVERNALEQNILNIKIQLDERLYQSISVGTPILMFPLRLETKFINDSTGLSKYQLYVRVFPDDAAIQTHEQELTAEEMTEGQLFWETAFEVEEEVNSISYAKAWRQLSSKYGVPRAAWIFNLTRPINFEAIENAIKTNNTVPEPDFPTVSLKGGAWTQPAMTYMMPEQFVFNLYPTYPATDPTLIIRKYSRKVENPLQVGLNPALGDDLFNVVTEGNPNNDPKMAWLTDFRAAVDAGLGVEITLTKEQYDAGFDRLVVVGVKFGLSNTEYTANLEDLFNSHHYTEGLKLLPTGTATNNTTNKKSGYSEADWLNAEESIRVELGEPLYDENGATKTDGYLLADALGINKQVFQHVSHADKQDVREAVMMNKCLWHATLGYYFEELLRPLLTQDDIDDLRVFFTEHVQARGPLPAFSVGSLPYGIQLTTDYSQWEEKSNEPFNVNLNKTLNTLRTGWHKSGSTQTSTNALEQLLEHLGLEASSSEFYQRYGFGPVLSKNLLNEELKAVATEGIENRLSKSLSTIDLIPEGVTPKILESTFQAGSRKLVDTFSDQAMAGVSNYGHFIDINPLSEETPLTSFPLSDKNYIDWLASNGFEQVRQEDFSSIYDDVSLMPASFEKPDTLLYYFLRHSLMLAYWDAAVRILTHAGTPVNREEVELFHVLNSNDSSRWTHLDTSLTLGGVNYASVKAYLENQLSLGREQLTVETKGFVEPLYEIIESLRALATLPTARLERLFAEHLDLCSYRLDAWKTGQVNKRLKQLRENQNGVEGVFLGAYGWLTDLRQKMRIVDEDHIQLDTENLGYIHAPSINHATTAAILRQGYDAQKNKGQDNTFAVDLSSGRVRQSLSVLEGVREGQTLGALLGYQFERGLHDNYTIGAELDKYISHFRKKFPLAGIVDEGDNTLAESVAARNVTDGLKLTEAYQQLDDFKTFMGILLDLQPSVIDNVETYPDHADYPFIEFEIKQLLITLDATSDLLVAEGVYQTVLGKLDSAGASLDSLQNGQLPPLPEIVQTPRRETALTQRVVLNLDVSSLQGGSATLSGQWATVALTPRALAEPSLNGWLSKMLEELATAEIGYTTTEASGLLSVLDLGLHPIDLIEYLDQGAGEKGSAFYNLVRYELINQSAIGFTDELTLSSVGLLQQFMPLIVRLKQILGQVRPGNATDISFGTLAGDNPEGYDLAEFTNRIITIRDRLTAVFTEYQLEVEQLNSEEIIPNLARVRELLFKLSFYNMPEAIAVTLLEDDQILAAASPLVAAAQKKLSQADSLVSKVDITLGQTMSFESGLEAARILFGKAFNLIPLFTLTQTHQQALGTAMANSSSLFTAGEDPALEMDEWLYGIARVKERMEIVEKITMLHEVLNTADDSVSSLDLQPVQLPLQFDELNNYSDKWMGKEMPAGYTPEGDKLSIVFIQPEGIGVSSVLAGLLIDEWVETIPESDVTSAVAFHFDQPQSQPPQALLLAVSPTLDGKWDYSKVLGAVNETLDMAVQRAVEPDDLALSPFAQLLPAVVAPVSTSDATISLDFARTIKNPQFFPAQSV